MAELDDDYIAKMADVLETRENRTIQPNRWCACKGLEERLALTAKPNSFTHRYIRW